MQPAHASLRRGLTLVFVILILVPAVLTSAAPEEASGESSLTSPASTATCSARPADAITGEISTMSSKSYVATTNDCDGAPRGCFRSL